jgi:hypothetical protein
MVSMFVSLLKTHVFSSCILPGESDFLRNLKCYSEAGSPGQCCIATGKERTCHGLLMPGISAGAVLCFFAHFASCVARY